MFALLSGLFDFFSGLFTSSGFFAGFVSFLGGWFAKIFSKVGEVWTYLTAYHIVEILKKLLFLSLLSIILGFVLHYAFSSLLVFNGSSLSSLVNSYISDIANFGAIGIDFLAFATKIGFFISLKIILNVMIFTLFARVALTIIFK